MSLQFWIEIIAALSLPAAVIGLLIERIKTGKGIGVRAIQFLGIAMLVPATIILALEKAIDGGVVGTLLGATAGYLFSNISEFDRQKD